MTTVKSIRQKSLWQQYDMLSLILDATEELVHCVDDADQRESIETELAENREAQRRLRLRAERIEGVRDES